MNPFLAARLATGGTGIPFYVETDMDYGTGRFTGLMVPGTLVAPFGRTHADAWALTARGHRRIEEVQVATRDIWTQFHRIASLGDEEVVVSRRLGNRLLLEQPSRERSSQRLPLLSWPGLEPGSDTRQWLRALKGEAPEPSLLRADGVRWTGAGWTPTGRPTSIVEGTPGILFVTDARPESSPQATVAGMVSAPEREAWMQQTLSLAAGPRLARILTFYADSLITDPREQEALRYLKNWNLEYGAAEPGASIYERLLDELPDSMGASQPMQEALSRTVRTLTRQYGPEMSSWRWETVQERTVRYPGATSTPADGGRTEERFVQQYLPVTLRAPGHPQSLVWGAPPSADSLRITSVWEGTLDLRSGTLFFRRPAVEFNRFLGTF